jgi:hypothetical protein
MRLVVGVCGFVPWRTARLYRMTRGRKVILGTVCLLGNIKCFLVEDEV